MTFKSLGLDNTSYDFELSTGERDFVRSAAQSLNETEENVLKRMFVIGFTIVSGAIPRKG